MATFATDKDLSIHVQKDVQLGVDNFFATTRTQDKVGQNGLPLTPATTEIVGRFQLLKASSFHTLLHPNLCDYVEIVKGKHDRLFVIFEYHNDNFGKLYSQPEDEVTNISSVCIDEIRKWAFQILNALSYLNDNNIIHHNLAPRNILLDAKRNVKLADYGFFYMTGEGADVDFPIGYPHYLPPEAIYKLESPYSSGKIDVWSIGVIFAEIFTKSLFWEGNDKDIEKIFTSLWKLQSLGKNDENGDDRNQVWDSFSVCQLGINEAIVEFLQGSSSSEEEDPEYLEFRQFIRACLEVNVSNRCTPEQLLSHDFFNPIHKQHQQQSIVNKSGGDVESELAKRGLLLSTPPIERIPRTVKVSDGKEEGTSKDTAFLFSDTIYTLSLKELRQRLEVATGPNRESFEWDTDYFLVVDTDDMNFLVDSMTEDNNTNFNSSNHNSDDKFVDQHLPSNNSYKKDVGYQFQRVSLFSELLREYPTSRDDIMHHAKVDIPPFLRGKIWAAILGVTGDYQAVYDAYDKESEKENTTDRQIDVDVPRCHQYHQLLSSPVGHEKLRRLLKCFVTANNKSLVYWQGLDSICATFLTQNFNDEALAFNCLQMFIPKFLKNVFLFDNSAVIQEYLAVFRHLLSFHDPELSSHLNRIGFVPDLYAIPWFLTLFTHVFPLDKTYHLWDKLLVGPSSLPLFAGISILRQLRDVLLASEFNDCISMISESFPEVDIEKCIQSALSMCKVTPPSVVYRVHDPNSQPHHQSKDEDFQVADHPNHQRWWEQPIPVEVKKAELAPRISLKDLVKLKNYVLVIDTRGEDEFNRGHFPLSFNVNPAQLDHVAPTLRQQKKKYHVVLAKRGDSGPQFANDLVNARFPRVAVLTGGIDVMRVDAAEGVPVCSCRTVKSGLSGSKNKEVPITISKCKKNLMRRE
ncbi:12090_t:CDS:10 [Ambispora leptoticha]|uniref:12090_t:CDS:1 n=1 Tax=Ambispora leptoticha TaxID=144679 RepID=A0A9N8YMQ8_9GLOM|nr:12090_t:CDS:10 [Ambispora leptoticha]